jgi:methionyl-tRNA formyltransferase
MDAGPVYGMVTEPVRPTDTSGDLLGRIAISGAQLLVATLDGIEDGTLRAEPQPAEGVSFAPKLGPPDARVDWKRPAHLIDRLIRACTPEPGAWTEFDASRLKLWPVTLLQAAASDGIPDLAPGELHVTRAAVYAGTGSRPVLLGDVQPPGKRRMPAADWARGLQAAGPGAPALGFS